MKAPASGKFQMGPKQSARLSIEAKPSVEPSGYVTTAKSVLKNTNVMINIVVMTSRTAGTRSDVILKRSVIAKEIAEWSSVVMSNKTVRALVASAKMIETARS